MEVFIILLFLLLFIPYKNKIKFIIKYNYKLNKYEIFKETEYICPFNIFTYTLSRSTHELFTFKDDAQNCINEIMHG